MKILDVSIKNFKSFGNNEQSLRFSENGELILVYGENGEGKSSLLESIELSLYRQVRGKNKTKIPLEKLPNRINKNLNTSVRFFNQNGQFIESTVKLSPNDYIIKIDGENKTDWFKKLNQKEKDNLIGFDYKTFKFFISMSINDFLNFMLLPTDDKKNLLDRFFNIEEITEYLNIIKDNIKQLNNQLEKNNNIISQNDIKIVELKETYQKIKDNININLEKELESLTNELNGKKTPFININNNIKKIDVDLENLEKKSEKIQSEIKLNESLITRKRIELNHLNEKISIYKKGDCPLCDTKLKSEHNIIEVMVSDKETLDSEILKLKNKVNLCNSEINDVKNDIYNLNKERKTFYNEFLNLKSEIENLKTKIGKLKNQEKTIFDDELNRLKTDYTNINEQSKKLKIDNDELIKKINNYNKLYKIIGDDGIRKEIILSMIKPINEYLEEYLSLLNFDFKVVLDENFDAVVYEREINEISSETMSNGENKIINILIALSYIKLLHKIKYINVLFLDEVFNSISQSNVELILKLLKKLSKDLSINIILIHHGVEQFNTSYFDRIIRMEKETFSNILEK